MNIRSGSLCRILLNFIDVTYLEERADLASKVSHDFDGRDKEASLFKLERPTASAIDHEERLCQGFLDFVNFQGTQQTNPFLS